MLPLFDWLVIYLAKVRRLAAGVILAIIDYLGDDSLIGNSRKSGHILVQDGDGDADAHREADAVAQKEAPRGSGCHLLEVADDGQGAGAGLGHAVRRPGTVGVVLGALPDDIAVPPPRKMRVPMPMVL